MEKRLEEVKEMKEKKDQFDKMIGAIEKISDNYLEMFNKATARYNKKERKRDNITLGITIALIVSLLVNVGMIIYTINLVNSYNTIEETYEVTSNDNYDVKQDNDSGNNYSNIGNGNNIGE